jgi:Zn-dependent metalloprotease
VRLIKRKRKFKSRRPAKAASSRSKPRAAVVGNNGLVGKALPADEVDAERPAPRARSARAARALGGPAPAAPAAASPTKLKNLDPEASARQYLERSFASDRRRSLARPVSDSGASEFRILGAEAIPLTGTTTVKFRQTVNKIPVYGSLVTVELDKSNRCVGINSSLGTPDGVNHVARISPERALAVAAKASGQPRSRLKNTPILNYYFHDSTWRLAYIIENVPQRKRTVLSDGRSDAVLKDYVVDAHSGKLLAGLPRTSTMAAVTEKARDGRRANRRIAVEKETGGRRLLRDVALNLTTCDFGFKDPSRQSRLLPGLIGANPPNPWAMEAVGAHANAADVARFLRRVVKRNNIDNKGGEMVSSVNCWDREESTRHAREWRNAYWNEKQMVYGQVRFPDGSFYSIANMLDIVGHEMFHGVTDHTARLEYVTQPGALNESYSDIFGVIIGNYGRPIGRWEWDIGVGFDGKGTVLRNMKDPTREGQPKLMKDFRKATPPYTIDRNDYGHVHDNSGIHNYAAYRVMTAKRDGKYLFKASEIAGLFYIALTQHLSRTSLFTDSRRAAVQAARSLFRRSPASVRDRKTKAVEAGYSAAGIK